jgi:hypothetical protein
VIGPYEARVLLRLQAAPWAEVLKSLHRLTASECCFINLGRLGLTKADGELVRTPDLLEDLDNSGFGLGVPHELSMSDRVGRVKSAPTMLAFIRLSPSMVTHLLFLGRFSFRQVDGSSCL